jgi:hypothetical protein
MNEQVTAEMLNLIKAKNYPNGRKAILYKYYNLKNIYNITSLNDNQVYFSKPEDFNDPHDCTGRLMLEYPKRFDIEKSNTNTTNESRRNFWEQLGEPIKNNIIFCVSEADRDPLMWAHYADGLRGFCIGFDSSGNLLEKAIKVQYNQLPEAESIYDAFRKTPPVWNGTVPENEDNLLRLYEIARNLFCIKLPCWSYEQEWRVINSISNGQLYTFGKKEVREIIFGEHMSKPNRRLLKDIMLSKYQFSTPKIAKISGNGIEITDLCIRNNGSSSELFDQENIFA